MSTQNPLRRAAVLISSLPPEAAARVLATMSPDQRQRVRTEARRLGNIDDAERKKIIAAFMKSTEKKTPDKTPATAQDANKIPSASDQNGTSQTPAPLTGFEFLHEIADDVLHHALCDQPAQAIAVVLAHLPPTQAARVLGKLQMQVRDQVIVRLSRIDQVTPDALADLGDHLRGLLSETLRKQNGVGRRALQAMAGHLEPDILHAVQRSIPDMPLQTRPNSLGSEPLNFESTMHSPAFAAAAYDVESIPTEFGTTEIRVTRGAHANLDEAPNILPFSRTLKSDAAANPASVGGGMSFHEIQQLPPTTIRRLLAEVDSEIAVLALLGMRVDVAESVLSTLPRRQAKQVRREIASLGPLLIRDIDRAQSEVEKAARKLQQIGALSLTKPVSAAAA